MKRRGSVLIMFLWVLMTFSLFTLSVAFRSRLAAKIRGYEAERSERQRDSFSAVNLARYFLEIDESEKVDSRLDDWYGVPEGFDRMRFSKKFGLAIVDEESKLNLNKTTPETLLAVLEALRDRGVRFEAEPRELASRLLAWRGEPAPFGRAAFGDEDKKAPYESLDELLLVPRVSPGDAAALKPFVTVFGPPAAPGLGINLNTVHPYVLEGIVRSLAGSDAQKAALLRGIERFRGGRGDRKHPELNVFFPQDLEPAVFSEKLGLENTLGMNQLVQFLLFNVTVDSEVFRIEVRALSAPFGRKPGVFAEAVLGPLGDRAGPPLVDAPASYSAIPRLEVLSWHENFSGSWR